MTPAFTATLTLLWTITLWQAVRESVADEPQWSLPTAFGILSAAMTLDWTPLSAAVNDIIPVPRVSILLYHCLGVLAGAAALQFVTELPGAAKYPHTYRRVIYAISATVLLALAVLFLITHTQAGGAIPNHHTVSSARNTIFTAFIALVTTTLTYLNVNGAVHNPSRPARVGLALAAAGTALGIVYVGFRIATLLSMASPASVNPILDTSFAFVACGACVPIITSAPQTLTGHRELMALYGLWRPLRRTVPHVVMDNCLHRTMAAITFSDLKYRQSRRVTEIHDAAREIRPFARSEARVHNMLATIHPTTPLALIEPSLQAARLELARRASRRDHPPDPHASRILSGGDTLHREVHWLIQVALARDTELVHQTVAALDNSPLPSTPCETDAPTQRRYGHATHANRAKT
jgi:hypothetical protein